MSLVALNAPPLVASAGAMALAAFPTLERAVIDGSIPFNVVKIVNCVLYALNVFATSQPGRIDGAQAARLAKGEGSKPKTTTTTTTIAASEPDPYIDDSELDRRSRTLVKPAGWAFAIWGPIFLGELIFCASHLLIPESSLVADVVKRASGGFIMAQILQTLWTATFRPRYKGKYVFVSGALLTGISLSLSRAHAAFVADRSLYNVKDYWLYFLPMTLHFGWTTAATLLNWNASIASREGASPMLLAVVGHVSVVAATVVGVGITLSRGAPVFGLVIAWALWGCAADLKKRLKPDTTNKNNFFSIKSKKNEKEAGVYGARLQRRLCLTGAWISASASPIALWSMRAISGSSSSSTK
jgi:hypothetical protein